MFESPAIFVSVRKGKEEAMRKIFRLDLNKKNKKLEEGNINRHGRKRFNKGKFT